MADLKSITDIVQRMGAGGGLDPRAILLSAAKNGVPESQLPAMIQSLTKKKKSASERLAERKLSFIEDAPAGREGELLGLEPSAFQRRLGEAQLREAEEGPKFRKRQLDIEEERVAVQKQKLEASNIETAQNFVRLQKQDNLRLEEFEQREDIEILRSYRDLADKFNANLTDIDYNEDQAFNQLLNVVSTGRASIKSMSGSSFGYIIGDSMISQLLDFGLRSENTEFKSEINFAVKQILEEMNKVWDPETMASIHEKTIRSIPVKSKDVIGEDVLEEFKGIGRF